MREAVGDAASATRPRRRGARERILDAIRASEQLSRVELAAATGLTEAAVSMTVRRLLQEGLIVETGRAPTAGKPRTLLRLDPAARLAVGIYLDEETTTYVLTGQTGGVVSRMARPAPENGDQDTVLRQLAADVDVLLAGTGVDPARCLGVGVVWPGPRSGLIRPEDAPPHLLGWRGDELGRQLAKATDWPVLVENDATAAAVGEYWVARVGPEKAFAALYMGSGIGAGLIIEGRAMRGGQGSAGEFGHLCLQVDGPECWCGSQGCLEVLAGPRTVVAAALADPVATVEAGLGAAGPRRSVSDFAAVARAARTGAPRCRALLEDSARYVSAAAESVVNLLDLDLIVLTGPGFAAASSIYGPAITQRVARADARIWHRSVTVTVSLAAATASATGAAALVLQSHMGS